MTENQKLREALSELIEAYNRAGPELSRAERAVDRMRLIAAHEALALPTADHIPDAGEMVVDHLPDAGKMIETAAPDMPLSMNQFGRLVELTREHLTDNTFVYKATSKAGDTCHFGVESAAKAWAKGGTVEAIKVREFKLHSSSPTAPPVGEREAFEELIEEFEAAAIDKHDCRNPEYEFEHRAYDAACQRYDTARAALRAGDAVDGQSNASRWVASADRYPPEGERVFFMDLATNVVGFDMWAGEGFMWMPSHWMPIPPAPAMRKGQL